MELYTQIHVKFPEHLLQQGGTGGAEAAYKLLSRIKDHLTVFQGSEHWKIMVRIYIDYQGLIYKCLNGGLVNDGKYLRRFCAGFSQSQSLFDIVDAYHGDEQPGHKIKGKIWTVMLPMPR